MSLSFQLLYFNMQSINQMTLLREFSIPNVQQKDEKYTSISRSFWCLKIIHDGSSMRYVVTDTPRWDCRSGIILWLGCPNLAAVWCRTRCSASLEPSFLHLKTEITIDPTHRVGAMAKKSAWHALANVYKTCIWHSYPVFPVFIWRLGIDSVLTSGRRQRQPQIVTLLICGPRKAPASVENFLLWEHRLSLLKPC